MKDVIWVGTSKDNLLDFPSVARQRTGYQIHRLQEGKEPNSWKPMSTVGAGVCEIRVSDDAGIYRTMYVAKFADAVYILHCFVKKSQKTSKQDMATAKARYAEVMEARKRRA